MATAASRGVVGRKPEANVGLDEQESDKRPTPPGKAAVDADAQSSPGGDEGKSGEAQRKATRLTPGGLSDRPQGLRWRRRHRMIRQKSAEVIVVVPLLRRRAEFYGQERVWTTRRPT